MSTPTHSAAVRVAVLTTSAIRWIVRAAGAGQPCRWVTGRSLRPDAVGMFIECVDGGLVYLAKIVDIQTVAVGGADSGAYITLQHPRLPARHEHQERIRLLDEDALALINPCHAPLAWPNCGSYNELPLVPVVLSQRPWMTLSPLRGFDLTYLPGGCRFAAVRRCAVRQLTLSRAGLADRFTRSRR